MHFNYSIAVKYLFLGWLVFLLRRWNHTVGGNNLSSLQTRASCFVHGLVFLCSVVSVKPEGSAAEDKCKNIRAVEQHSAKINPFFLSVSGFVKELVINQFLISVCLKNKMKYGHVRNAVLWVKAGWGNSPASALLLRLNHRLLLHHFNHYMFSVESHVENFSNRSAAARRCRMLIIIVSS